MQPPQGVETHRLRTAAIGGACLCFGPVSAIPVLDNEGKCVHVRVYALAKSSRLHTGL